MAKRLFMKISMTLRRKPNFENLRHFNGFCEILQPFEIIKMVNDNGFVFRNFDVGVFEHVLYKL